MKYILITLPLSLLLLASCGTPNNKNAENAMNPNHSIDLANFDTTVTPADNFYQYVNGNWVKNHPVPSSEATWTNFNIIQDNNLANLRTLLDEAASAKSEPGSPKQKVGDFYSTAMDSVKLNQEGILPLEAEFNLISAIKSSADLPAAIAHLHNIGVRPLFDFSVEADSKASTQNITTLSQGGLGLPDMDYYLNPDPSLKKIREQYMQHIAAMFKLLGESEKQASSAASAIFDLEKKLAEKSMTRVQLRDIEAQYNKKTLSDFINSCPNFGWPVYFKTLGIDTKVDHLIIGQPEFFARIESVIKSTPIEDWKNYLRWNLIGSSANKLGDKFVQERFNFYGTVLSGSKTLRPRWKRVIQQSDQSLGDLLGQLYVEKYFSAEAKAKVNIMVDNLIASFKERINTRDWMSAETKKQALHKLETIMRKLAYPDKWRDYSSLIVKRDSYVQNYFRANTCDFKYMTDKLGKPVDKTEWGMTPSTVNAYYNPSYNEIVFPAGIMQIPFFDPNADDAVNYGAMGAIIGHELTHGFDDQGCQFDADGNLKNWWTKEDSLHFKERTNKVVDQFNHFAVLDTLHVNGELTLGENIADLGGLTIAYYAYKKSLEGKPAPEKINGFTGEQRFFISWAQGWRGNMRPEYLKQLLKTNPHSPNIARVMAPLANMQEFYAAFNVKEGNGMFRAEKDRPVIW
jgi:putative endopeptidase